MNVYFHIDVKATSGKTYFNHDATDIAKHLGELIAWVAEEGSEVATISITKIESIKVFGGYKTNVSKVTV